MSSRGGTASRTSRAASARKTQTNQARSKKFFASDSTGMVNADNTGNKKQNGNQTKGTNCSNPSDGKLTSKPSAGQKRNQGHINATPNDLDPVKKQRKHSLAMKPKVSQKDSLKCKEDSHGRYATRKSICMDVKQSRSLKKTGDLSDEKRTCANMAGSEAETVEVSDRSAVPENDRTVKKEPADPAAGDREESAKLVGAHCSVAGGLHNAVQEAADLGGRSFALFLRSQRTWASKPLDPEIADKFKTACKDKGYPPNAILPHGSYLMNCGSPNPDTLRKSREALLDELQRCEALGLTLYNFHPGSTCGEITINECLDQIADCINWAHKQTKFVTTVIENMSCQGNTVGGRFEELRGIIDRVQDKSRVGVCLDTCHAFAAGFDLSSKDGFDKFVSDFDNIVGFQYLKAMHLNDSKGGVGCHLDRHENIGKGHIGLDGFRYVMQEPRFDGIPMILETPVGDYAGEIKILNSLACRSK